MISETLVATGPGLKSGGSGPVGRRTGRDRRRGRRTGRDRRTGLGSRFKLEALGLCNNGRDDRASRGMISGGTRGMWFARTGRSVAGGMAGALICGIRFARVTRRVARVVRRVVRVVLTVVRVVECVMLVIPIRCMFRALDLVELEMEIVENVF